MPLCATYQEIYSTSIWRYDPQGLGPSVGWRWLPQRPFPKTLLFLFQNDSVGRRLKHHHNVWTTRAGLQMKSSDRRLTDVRISWHVNYQSYGSDMKHEKITAEINWISSVNDTSPCHEFLGMRCRWIISLVSMSVTGNVHDRPDCSCLQYTWFRVSLVNSSEH